MKRTDIYGTKMVNVSANQKITFDNNMLLNRTVDRFSMNGYLWSVRFVKRNDPILVDRTDLLKVATTDPETLTVNLSNELHGDFLMTVFLHELGHCTLWSFGLLYEIRRMTKPEYWVDMEEFICNFLADYGLKIFKIGYQTMGFDAWKNVPKAFNNLFAS